jgi:hypothetical protein
MLNAMLLEPVAVTKTAAVRVATLTRGSLVIWQSTWNFCSDETMVKRAGNNLEAAAAFTGASLRPGGPGAESPGQRAQRVEAEATLPRAICGSAAIVPNRYQNPQNGIDMPFWLSPILNVSLAPSSLLLGNANAAATQGNYMLSLFLHNPFKSAKRHRYAVLIKTHRDRGLDPFAFGGGATRGGSSQSRQKSNQQAGKLTQKKFIKPKNDTYLTMITLEHKALASWIAAAMTPFLMAVRRDHPIILPNKIWAFSDIWEQKSLR